jgi:hypothetical protein
MPNIGGVVSAWLPNGVLLRQGSWYVRGIAVHTFTTQRLTAKSPPNFRRIEPLAPAV